MRLPRVISTAPFSLALITTLLGCVMAGAEPLPNIVIILVDDMGYGDPGCYNRASRVSTPNIDALAQDGMRFTDAHAAGPLCHMSRYGLLTGRSPLRVDFTRWPTHPLIETGQTTIATLAKDHGYRTAMVGKWHVGFRELGYDQPLRGGPIDCGFDSFFGIRASTDIFPLFYIRGDQAVHPPDQMMTKTFIGNWSRARGQRELHGPIAQGMKIEEVTPGFTQEAIRTIRQHAEQPTATRPPLMLYLAYPSPHSPWLPETAFRGTSPVGAYGDFIAMIDAHIGRVLNALAEGGLSDNTLVLFASDNGPCWYEQDVQAHQHDAAGGLRGMKADLWEAGHRVPMIARWPGRVRAGSVSRQVICFTDVLATFADLFAEPGLPGLPFDSESFLPVLTGRRPEDQPIRGPLVIPAGAKPGMAVRIGPWKLINQLGSAGFSKPKRVHPEPDGPQGQLYNLSDDPTERYNLYEKRPDIVHWLEAELQHAVEAE